MAHAGEVIQGFSAAMAAGTLTWRALRAHTVSVHPTSAEELVRVVHQAPASRQAEPGAAPATAGC